MGYFWRVDLRVAREQTWQPEEDRLLKIDEVAARLRLRRSAVYNLIWRGELPYVNVSCGSRRAPRVRVVDLGRFIEKRTCRSGLMVTGKTLA